MYDTRKEIVKGNPCHTNSGAKRSTLHIASKRTSIDKCPYKDRRRQLVYSKNTTRTQKLHILFYLLTCFTTYSQCGKVIQVHRF